MLVGDREQDRVLDLNATYTASLDGRFPEGISGTYYLLVAPDALNTIREGDGDTTGAQVSPPFTIEAYPYADLTVKNVVAPSLIIGDPIDLVVSWDVENVGTGPGRTTTWSDRSF